MAIVIGGGGPIQLRNLIAAAALLSVATVIPAASGAHGRTVVTTRITTLGKIVVSSGRTLYHTSAEQKNVVTCTASCAVRWPPLVVSASARPVAGAGVRTALLGTVRRPDGRMQVTYGGLPLYFFSGDSKPGQVKGEGLGGRWHAVAPSGAVVTAHPASAAASTSMGGSGSTMGSGTGASSGAGTGAGSTTTTSSTPPAGANPGMWCAANPSSCVNGVPVAGAPST